MNNVTVCIPSIPPRQVQLDCALRSVEWQEEPPDATIVQYDHHHEGAAATRNLAWRAATTEWIAFLDDDDELFPQHLAHLFARQRETDADVVWPWFETSSNFKDPLGHEGREWDPAVPHSFPITTIVRRSLAEEVGGFPLEIQNPMCAGEDFEFWKACSAAGGKFVHLHERTWRWNFHGKNTSGLGTRW